MRIILWSIAQEVNFGPRGVATQSSTYKDCIPARAIDGNTDNEYGQKSCTQTLKDSDPWWKVTFKYDILVKKVVIVNRGDCCGK